MFRLCIVAFSFFAGFVFVMFPKSFLFFKLGRQIRSRMECRIYCNKRTLVVWHSVWCYSTIFKDWNHTSNRDHYFWRCLILR
jgi:hypothetical protein